MFRHRINRIEKFPGLRPLKKPARDYLDSNVFCGLIKDPFAAKFKEEIGVDRLMWGSDFPHPNCTFPETHKVLDEILAGFSPDDRRKIVAGNTQRVYNIVV
jgi:predicted TIM-barrel fold metal-dependent hydrolase